MTDYPMRGGILDQLEPPEAYAKREREMMARAKALQEARRRNALLKWGGEPVLSMEDIPSLPESGQAALDGLDAAGQFASAFGPMGAMAGAGTEAVGVGAQALRQVPRWMLGPGAMAADANAARAAAQNDRQMAFVNKLSNDMAGMAGRPPNAGPRALNDESRAVMEFLDRNPYSGPIPGRAGIPPRAERIGMVNRYFREGGRLPKRGPWEETAASRNMPDAVSKILREQYAKEAAKGPVKTKAKTKKPKDLLTD